MISLPIFLGNSHLLLLPKLYASSCSVSDIWCGAAGQGFIVCRIWVFADNQSGQFPKARNSLPFVLLQSFSACRESDVCFDALIILFMRNKSGWIVTGITTVPSVSSLERFTDGMGISSLSHSIL